MELLCNRDLVTDECGNYYTIVNTDLESVTLVNAFMELSFRRILYFNESVKKELSEYEGHYFGRQAMDTLKNQIKNLEEGTIPGGIYSLDEVKKVYKVNFVPLYEKNPHHFIK